ncbi:MAG: J domain-containing protein, partial [Oligoflexia bacterium]|nr:J domain-containing protein [Oligoflexia bacterium]
GGRRVRRGPRPGQDISATVTVSLLDVARGIAIDLDVRRPVVANTGGQGTLVMQTEKLKVRLPPAMEDGKTIRLRGKGGESTSGGPAGDLLITVCVGPSPGLSRDGDTLELDVPITFAEALVGGQITVPTLDGDVKVTVPAGVQQGQRLRVRGKGMRLKKGRGDLLLVLRPTPPADPGPKASTLAKELAALYDRDVRDDVTL